jgi:hypothetical protein
MAKAKKRPTNEFTLPADPFFSTEVWIFSWTIPYEGLGGLLIYPSEAQALEAAQSSGLRSAQVHKSALSADLVAATYGRPIWPTPTW